MLITLKSINYRLKEFRVAYQNLKEVVNLLESEFLKVLFILAFKLKVISMVHNGYKNKQHQM